MKEKLAEQYADIHMEKFDITKSIHLPYYHNDRHKVEDAFVAGYEAATKWKKVEEELPNNDRTVLVWVNNTQNPHWSTYNLGSYTDDNWYVRGGRGNHEIVEKWVEIAK